MTALSTAGIYGSEDGKSPLIDDPNSLGKIWFMSDIYLGRIGENRYVPKVGDIVLDVASWEWFEVMAIDVITLIPTLRERNNDRVSGNMSTDDVLMGVGPGTQSDTYRVYHDTSVMPAVLSVDVRLRVAGTMTQYCKIFKGADVSANGKVISAFYDQNGTMLGQNIPLELAAMENYSNKSIKVVARAYTSEPLVNGELVTAVLYASDGHVVSKRQLLVENTAFIRSTNLDTKYIIAISMKSPWLSRADPSVLEYPLNVPLQGLDLIGVVHYSDGSTRELPVDGTKFTIFGFEHYVATIVGQRLPLVLNYRLSSNEVAYDIEVGEHMNISREYTAVTRRWDGAYSVKLYAYPVWVSPAAGYRLEWFLYNLQRGEVYNVTPWVRIDPNGPGFQPNAYGTRQQFQASLLLRDVNETYTSYRHTQAMDITLIEQATMLTTNWVVRFTTNQQPPFGENNAITFEFVNVTFARLQLSMGVATLEEWLERLYYRTQPLIDRNVESVPPRPTHFRLVIGNTKVSYPIEQWATEVISGVVPANHGTVFLEFYKELPDTVLELSVAGVTAHQTN